MYAAGLVNSRNCSVRKGKIAGVAKKRGDIAGGALEYSVDISAGLVEIGAGSGLGKGGRSRGGDERTSRSKERWRLGERGCRLTVRQSQRY